MIYKDGTFLQFSMNYHRVVIQLLSYAICISRLNDDKLKALGWESKVKFDDVISSITEYYKQTFICVYI